MPRLQKHNVITPILQRELLSATRKPSLHWIRLAVSAASLLFSAWILLPLGINASAESGQNALRALTGFALAYCLLAGLWTTADSISSERREGTLPLLFLTRLGPLGVLLGKLTSNSINALYGLFALLPMLCIPLMAGGVSATQLWMFSLTLFCTLLLSLSAGLLASTIVTAESAAASLALGLVLAPTLGGFLFGWFILFFFSHVLLKPGPLDYSWMLVVLLAFLAFGGWAFTITETLFLGSPLAAWALSSDALSNPQPATLFATLAITFLFALFYAALSRAHLVSCFNEDPPQVGAAILVHAAPTLPSSDYKPGLLGKEPSLRSLLLAGAPATGLGFTNVVAALCFWMLPFSFTSFHWNTALLPFALLAKALLALAIGRVAASFFTELRKSSFLEVLLTTPIPSSELIREQLRASWTSIKPNAIILCSIHGTVNFMHYLTAGPFNVPTSFILGALDLAVLLLFIQASLRFGIFFAHYGRKRFSAAALTALVTLLLPTLVVTLLAWACWRLLVTFGLWQTYENPVPLHLLQLTLYLLCYLTLTLLARNFTPDPRHERTSPFRRPNSSIRGKKD